MCASLHRPVACLKPSGASVRLKVMLGQRRNCLSGHVRVLVHSLPHSATGTGDRCDAADAQGRRRARRGHPGTWEVETGGLRCSGGSRQPGLCDPRLRREAGSVCAIVSAPRKQVSGANDSSSSPFQTPAGIIPLRESGKNRPVLSPQRWHSLAMLLHGQWHLAKVPKPRGSKPGGASRPRRGSQPWACSAWST